MTIVITGIEDFSIENYRRVAAGESVELDADVLESIDAVREKMLTVLGSVAANHPVYGVNVGAGDGSSTRLTADAQADYALGLNSATSFGDPLPERVVRGTIFARLASYVSGVSGVSATLAGQVAGMLAEPIPTVPRDASAGSGEILPLGHLFAQVPGRVRLGTKEAMALVNGSPCAGAMTADLTLRSRNLWPILLDISGLALHALNASDAHFDAALGDVWGTPVETAVLGDLRVRLADPSAPRASKQSRVSVRILPRVLAALSRAARDLEDVAQVALRYPGDNPSFVDSGTPGPRLISNGSFHQHQAVVAIDQYSRALSDLVRLAQHLLHALYQDEYAMPGQDNLALGVSYMAAAAWSEEARLNATPSLLSFAAVGQNDVPNPLFSAWNKADRVNRCATAQFALLGAMASQALYLSKRPATPELQSTLELVRRHVAPIDRRRDVGPDIAALDRELADAVANFDHPG